MVKTLLAALKASGCPVDLKRHLVSFYHHKFVCLNCGRHEFFCISNKDLHKVCEMCQPGSEVQHAGGYDPALNQVPNGVPPSPTKPTPFFQLELIYCTAMHILRYSSVAIMLQAVALSTVL